jgi:phosphoribosylformylglycinamidine cyclo-ligase
VVRRAAWPVPAVFEFLRRRGGISDEEMARVFNLGIGMIAIAPPEAVEAVQAAAGRAGVATWVIGEIQSGQGVEFA